MHQGRGDTIEPAVNDLLRLTLQLRVRNPTGRQLYQRFPAGLELQFKQHTDDAIVVILDLRNQLFSAAQYDWFQPLDDGWILEANIIPFLLRGGNRSANQLGSCTVHLY